MRLRRIAIGVGAIATVAALGIGLVPGLVAERVVAPRLSAAIGAPVHLGWLSWNPLRSTWTLHAVRVDAEHGPPALRIRRLVARIRTADLVRRRWAIRDVGLVGARLRLRATDAGWELPLAARPASPEVEESAAGWPIVTLEGGHAAPVTLRFEPRGGSPAILRLHRLELAGAIVTPQNVTATGSLRGRLERGKIALAASLRRTASADRVRARLAATRLDLRRTLRLVPRSLRAPGLAGLLDLHAAYEQLTHRGHGHRRLAGHGVARDLEVGAGGAPGVRAASLALDRFTVDLEGRRADLGRVRIRQGETRITRDDAGLSVPGLGSPDASPSESGGPGWQVTWAGLELEGGGVHYVDGRGEERRVDFEVTRAALAAADRPESAVPFSLDGRLGTGGSFSATGTLARAPFGVRGDISFQEVLLPPLAALSGAPLPLESGRAGGRLAVEAAEGDLSASGTVTVDDLKTSGPSGGRPEDVLAFKSLRSEVRRFRANPLQLELASLRIDWPYVLVDRDADGIFPLTVARTTTPTTAAAAAPVVRVGTFTVHGGRIDFRDLTLRPPYWRSLANLEASLVGVRVPPARVEKLRASGLVDELSPLRVEGTIGARSRLRADVERVALPPFNAYLKPVSDYLVASGALTAHSEITIERSQLEVTNRIVLSRLGLGGGSDEDFVQRQLGIPLTLALALMKDYRGDIELELPFTGDVASPRFSFRDVVLQAVVRAVRGAVLSPLTALGRVFLRDGRIEHFSLDPVPFPPGGRELDPEGRERVAQVGRVLRIHPELGVGVRGETAQPDLERIQAEKALATLGVGRESAQLRAVLEARLGGRPEPSLEGGARERLETVLASLPWPADDLRQLAIDRAAAVAAALLLEPGIDAKRVRAAPADAPVPGPLAPLPAAAIDLSEG